MKQIAAYLLMVLKSINLKQKISSIILGSVSKKVSVDNMTKNGLHGYVYDFSVDYDAIVVDDILDIHKYLMKKHDI